MNTQEIEHKKWILIRGWTVSLFVPCFVLLATVSVRPCLLFAQGETGSVSPQKTTTDRPRQVFVVPKNDSPFIGLIEEATDQQIVFRQNGETRTYSPDQLSPETRIRLRWRLQQEKPSSLIGQCLKTGLYELALEIASDLEQGAEKKKKTILNKRWSDLFPDLKKVNQSTLQKAVQEKQNQLQQQYESKRKQKKEKLKTEHSVHQIQTMKYRGDVAKRVDVVILSDGWSKSSIKGFHRIARQLKRNLKTATPFSNYPEYINFHRIDIIEEKDGLTGKTALEAEVKSNILRSNGQAVRKYAKLAPDVELAVVVANTGEGRATGSFSPRSRWGYMTIPRSGRIGNTFRHELGHAFGHLDDEYVDPKFASVKSGYSESEEDRHVNTTREENKWLAKWHYWLFPSTPRASRVGTYEGAYYRSKGYYRPEPSCRMRSSSSSFCTICMEQMERSFYEFVSPVDQTHPERPNVTRFRNQKQKFEVSAVITKAQQRGGQLGSLRANWYLDGEPVSNINAKGYRTWVRARDLELEPGRHVLAVRVNFFNKRIRRDYGMLSGEHAWTIDVLPEKKPVYSVSSQTSTTPETTLKTGIEFTDETQKEKFDVVALHLPPGAEFDNEKHVLSWTPKSGQSGVYPFRFGITNSSGTLLLEDRRPLSVEPNEQKNQPPFVLTPKSYRVEEGETLDINVRGIDPDGDTLHYEFQNLPEGAIYDSKTGRVYFAPGYDHGFEKYEVVVTVRDGRAETRKTFQLVILDRAVPNWKFTSRRKIKFGLRNLKIFIRKQALNKLKRFPEMYRFLTYVRFLRDRDKSIRSIAIERLRSVLLKPSMESSGTDAGDENGKRKQYLRNFFREMSPKKYLFHLTDYPEVLRFLDDVIEAAESASIKNKHIRSVKKGRELIRKYNKKRQRLREQQGK